ncbi:MAD2L1-binding protein-like [Mytilus californianus]|uniref:MAD2L1-binding protein-like n=1 Tax=Mytilus californianus TaxID=6549 RepID=UPI002245F86D|nr:MAD2L1-binding protein-like [Mytilus californianus]XP_052104307.1 MAD2L1-binding protein-like [Mytilus californianus]XP_052104308.1 MAD2L1-binding protein-like [Mytilus californianus]XP_052104309.1 MAD2L1-binding protein-like [Mytilus californianus]XP_052104310.1 MAD2L1-binding protein-like [Mytilus californianus]XP_052104311.1 MAD2L1-binding protein-like [Mytilus californianus]XP_052104312.1 MAD2L1-binding protein-like [Mytilus californianus]XP_052104313.1 MAD2L1-binding protein-like [My
MAFRKNTKIKSDSCKDLIFDGGIQSHTRCILVKEYLKYILYERQQIPVPYEQVKQGLKIMEDQLHNVNDVKTGPEHKQQKPPVRRSFVSKMELRKITKLVKGLDELFEKLVENFEICPEVRQVLFLLGGTTVSPKECYLITLPPYHPESNNLSSKFCIRYLMKELIMQDFVGKLKDVRTTNAIVMLNAPADSGIKWFLPKPNFTLPSRGTKFSLNLISNPNSDVFNHDLTHEENEIEISGIEPFDVSGLDASLEEEMMKLFISSDHTEKHGHIHIEKHGHVLASVDKAKRLSRKSFCLNNDDDTIEEKNKSSANLEDKLRNLSSENNNDISLYSQEDTILQKTIDDSKILTDPGAPCIWFQAPCMFKGYKDKTSRQSNGLM